MPEFYVPANLIQGRNAAESGGAGTALGDAAQVNIFVNPGVDLTPPANAGIGPGGINHKTIGYFATDTDGDSALEQPAANARALRGTNARGGLVLLKRGDAVIEVGNCAATFGNASGNFFVDPSDIGAGAGKINPNKQLLAADQLLSHPTVFVRNGQTARAIVTQQPSTDPATPLLPLAAPSVLEDPSVEVFTIDRAPTHSVWVLVVEGNAIQLTFAHPAGSNLRRPVDIWNTVVRLALVQANNDENALINLVTAVGVDDVSFQNRGLVTRLAYTDYARFVQANDADSDDITTAVYTVPA